MTDDIGQFSRVYWILVSLSLFITDLECHSISYSSFVRYIKRKQITSPSLRPIKVHRSCLLQCPIYCCDLVRITWNTCFALRGLSILAGWNSGVSSTGLIQ